MINKSIKLEPKPRGGECLLHHPEARPLEQDTLCSPEGICLSQSRKALKAWLL